jgi:hypothetical protein
MEMQQFIPDFLETNSITPALSRGKRWEWLKRRIRLMATKRYFVFYLGKDPSVTERPSRTLPSTRHNRIVKQTSRMIMLAEHS